MGKVDCTDPTNLPDKWNTDDIRNLFEKHGEIGDIFIPKDRETGRLRPFAFVRYFNDADADAAIRDLDGYKLEGVEITVMKATKSRDEAFAKTARPPARGYRADRGDRGRSRSR